MRCRYLAAGNTMSRPDDPAPAALPRLAVGLGYAGLIPPIAALGLILSGGPEWEFVALSVAFAYAALIYSFLGGVWWGLGARLPADAPRWIWAVSVLPSLIALACAWPWAAGGDWPGPSLVVLGVAIMSSILVDLVLARAGLTPARWLSLRIPLSLGLGGLTLTSGLATAMTG